MGKSIKIKEVVILAVITAIIGAMIYYAVDFIRFPEKYSTTWKYQLEQDIKNGDEEAIKYYNETYTKQGKVLFD